MASFSSSEKLPAKANSKKQTEQISDSKLPQVNNKSFICPFNIDQRDLNYFEILSKVSRFVRTFFVGTVPRFLKFGESLRALYNFGNNNTSVYIYPIKDSVAQSNLNEIISGFESQRLAAAKQGDFEKEKALQQKKSEADFLRDEISTNSNKLFEISILTSLFADSMEELDNYSDILGFEASKEAINIKSAWSQQDIAFSSNLPHCNNKLLRNNVFDMYSAAALIPFTSTDVSHHDGIPYGINNKSHIPIFIDAFSPGFANYNSIMLGSTKSAKSFALQIISLRSYALAGVPSIAIDSNGSYSILSETLDGNTVRIGNRSNIVLNPFEIEYEIVRDEITGRETSVLNLDKKIEDVTEILLTMSRGAINSQYVNKITREIIKEAVIQEYRDLGITTNPDSIYNTQGINLIGTKIVRNKKPLPTIGSWYKRICSNAAQNYSVDKKYHYEYLIKYMVDYIKELGGKSSYYDGQSNCDADFESSFISFDLSSIVTVYEKALAQHVLMSWIWEKYFKTNSEDKSKAVKRRVIMDEAWMCLPYTEASAFLQSMFSRATLKNISFTIVSDRFKDFYANESLLNVLKETSIKLLLKQDESDIELLHESFNLNRGESDFLRNCYKNEGIIQIGPNCAQIYFVLSEFEVEFIDTTQISYKSLEEPIKE